MLHCTGSDKPLENLTKDHLTDGIGDDVEKVNDSFFFF